MSPYPDDLRERCRHTHKVKNQTDSLPQYDNCFPPEIWIDDCFACNGDPNFDRIGKVNGSCTDATPPTGYYSWNNTSGFCAYDFPVDGIDYTTKYTALKFRIMQSALEAQNRTILYSLCEWGMSDPFSLSLYLLRTGELTHEFQVSTKYGPGAMTPVARGVCRTTSVSEMVGPLQPQAGVESYMLTREQLPGAASSRS